MRKSELVGTWYYVAESHRNALTLFENGSAKIEYFPEVSDEPSEQELIGQQSTWVIKDERVSVYIKLPGKSFSTGYDIEKKNGEIRLYYFIGDPDDYNRVVFRKRFSAN